MTFSEAELTYLNSPSPLLARLATIGPDGSPRVAPVGYFVNADEGTIDIGGFAMGTTQKFRNVQREPRVSLVIDDVASVQPWRVRGVEIRGRAEALTDVDPPQPHFSRELIRVRPDKVRSWGLDD